MILHPFGIIEVFRGGLIAVLLWSYFVWCARFSRSGKQTETVFRVGAEIEGVFLAVILGLPHPDIMPQKSDRSTAQEMTEKAPLQTSGLSINSGYVKIKP